MESQDDILSTLQEHELKKSQGSSEETACFSENNLYLPSFDALHINCLLMPRRKDEIKCIASHSPSKTPSYAAGKEIRSALHPRLDGAMGQDEKEDSLIFRPKNIRKEQQEACLHETPAKMDKKETLLSFNPEKAKKQQFKILTRRSQEYQSMIEWTQSQNPANITLPS